MYLYNCSLDEGCFPVAGVIAVSSLERRDLSLLIERLPNVITHPSTGPVKSIGERSGGGLRFVLVINLSLLFLLEPLPP
jgi:hypothetical protein